MKCCSHGIWALFAKRKNFAFWGFLPSFALWSKKHSWEKHLKWWEVNVSVGQMKGRETNLIQMIAEQMWLEMRKSFSTRAVEQPLSKKTWKKKNKQINFPLLLLTWFRKGRKGKNHLLERARDWDAIRQSVPSSLCSYFPVFLKLLLSHPLELPILMKSSLIQGAAEHTLPTQFNSSWFAWHSAGYARYLRGYGCSTIQNSLPTT